MDQEPQADRNSGAGNIDLNSILLPKKDAPSLDSAQRVDASTLLAQEQNATLQSAPQPASAPVFLTPQASQTQTADIVKPLETFQSDIASVVQQGASVVSIAAAEADRRGAQSFSGLESAPTQTRSWRGLVFVVVGVVLIAAAGGALWYVLSYNAPLASQQQTQAPYIAVDGTSVVAVAQTPNSGQLMQQLVSAKNNVRLSLGLVAQLYVEHAATSSADSPTYLTSQELLSTLAPSLPDTFLRNIAPVYLLGVHSFGINQPFLLMKVDSYEQAYAGMLAWEASMHSDLSPLFMYTPAPKIQVVQTPVSTTTAATSTASTTDISVSAPFVPSSFADKIVDNHDARVLTNADGTIYFLWTFLDRNTLLITTNEDTLHEVIARLTQAPV